MLWSFFVPKNWAPLAEWLHFAPRSFVWVFLDKSMNSLPFR